MIHIKLTVNPFTELGQSISFNIEVTDIDGVKWCGDDYNLIPNCPLIIHVPSRHNEPIKSGAGWSHMQLCRNKTASSPK